jgi:hypothetical protein
MGYYTWGELYLEILRGEPNVGYELGPIGEDAVDGLAPLVSGVLHIVLLLLLALNKVFENIISILTVLIMLIKKHTSL